MRAAPRFAAIALLACLLAASLSVGQAAQPAEFQTILDNIQALKVSLPRTSTPLLTTHQPCMHPPAHAPQAHTQSPHCLQVPGSKGTIGDALKGALTGWEYTLPLEFVRKGQAYVGPSLRLRRVMNDLMAGEAGGTVCGLGQHAAVEWLSTHASGSSGSRGRQRARLAP